MKLRCRAAKKFQWLTAPTCDEREQLNCGQPSQPVGFQTRGGQNPTKRHFSKKRTKKIYEVLSSALDGISIFLANSRTQWRLKAIVPHDESTVNIV